MADTKLYEILHKWCNLSKIRSYKVFQVQESKPNLKFKK